MLFDLKISDKSITVILMGKWQRFDVSEDLTKVIDILNKNRPDKIVLNAAGVEMWDSSLTVFVDKILKFALTANIPVKQEKFPRDLSDLLELLSSKKDVASVSPSLKKDFFTSAADWYLGIYDSVKKGLSFMRQTLSSLGRYIAGTAVMRKVDFLFALEDCGVKAVGIVSLISFMVGLILAFVGALQLKMFGAQIYVASLVSIAMTRIMGAIMTGIIMDGRTGASYAATIGSMQVNEELDALKTMGISRIDFLWLPRFLALIIAMPVLTALSDIMGILGGAFVGVLMMDISWAEYLKYTVDSFDTTNFLVGIFHGLVYGVVISICGCYYGIYCGRNADSVGQATTRAVVFAIVWMIVLTGILTAACEGLGI